MRRAWGNLTLRYGGTQKDVGDEREIEMKDSEAHFVKDAAVSIYVRSFWTDSSCNGPRC